jgi:hypothetical protein
MILRTGERVVLDDIAYALMLLLDRTWRDSPRRARRIARRLTAGKPVTVAGWVGEQADEPAIPGRVYLTPGSAAADWRPLNRRWSARTLVLRQLIGPATIRDGKNDRPFAHAWHVRDNTDTAAFLFIDRPYGALLAPLLKTTQPG